MAHVATRETTTSHQSFLPSVKPGGERTLSSAVAGKNCVQVSQTISSCKERSRRKAHSSRGVLLDTYTVALSCWDIGCFYISLKRNKTKKEGKEFQCCFHNTGGIINNCLMF